MKNFGVWMIVLVLAGCGVPRETGPAALRQAAALETVGTDDAAVRSALLAQSDAWNSLSNTVRKQVPMGVSVDPDFVSLVDQAAALGRRQRELIEHGTDDPAQNRALLETLKKLWRDVARYLGE